MDRKDAFLTERHAQNTTGISQHSGPHTDEAICLMLRAAYYRATAPPGPAAMSKERASRAGYSA